VHATNEAGVAVGSADDESGASYPVAWRSGVPAKIAGTPAGGIAVAINSGGVVIGTSRADLGGGWVSSNGKTTRLAAGDKLTVPAAINDRGSVVGTVLPNETAEDQSQTPNEDEYEHAIVWDTPSATVRILPALAGDLGSSAFAIDNQGRVGGISEGTQFRPVIWDAQGRARALPTLGGANGAVRGFGAGGIAFGDAVGSDGKDHAVTWDAAGNVVDLGLPQDARSAMALGSSGNVIVGTVEIPASGGGYVTRAVQWNGPGQASVLPVGSNRTGGVARGGSTAKEIVGNSTDGAGGRHPMIWRCG
jgi:hypothetical protein